MDEENDAELMSNTHTDREKKRQKEIISGSSFLFKYFDK